MRHGRKKGIVPRLRAGRAGLGLWAWGLLALAFVVAPASAGAEDVLVLQDGRSVPVPHAEVWPDRVRIETGPARDTAVPPGVPFTVVGPETIELSRGEVRAVFPQSDLPAAARPNVERYGDITQRLTDQVRQSLQRSWSLPPSPRR